jgi:hydrogenase nickel insertion protein HypA
MHEWALAEAVVAKAAEIAAEAGTGRIARVVVRIGELQEVSRDAFEFGLSVAAAQVPGMEAAEFVLETEPAVFDCRPCGRTWTLAETRGVMAEDDVEMIHLLPDTVHILVSCPSCGSPDFAIAGGRGVTLAEVESA